MTGTRPQPGDPERWRDAVRRALPAAGDDLIAEVAEHLDARWQTARDEGASADDADRLVFQDLAAWRARQAPVPPRLRRLTTGWSGELRHAWRLAARRPGFVWPIALGS